MKLNQGNMLIEVLIAIVVVMIVVSNTYQISKLGQTRLKIREQYEESFY